MGFYLFSQIKHLNIAKVLFGFMIIAHKVEKMERFAIKIDKKLKANLYKICRLCGMDHPDMVQILTENKNEEEKDPIMVDAEPQLSQKIQELIGLTVGCVCVKFISLTKNIMISNGPVLDIKR